MCMLSFIMTPSNINFNLKLVNVFSQVICLILKTTFVIILKKKPLSLTMSFFTKLFFLSLPLFVPLLHLPLFNGYFTPLLPISCQLLCLLLRLLTLSLVFKPTTIDLNMQGSSIDDTCELLPLHHHLLEVLSYCFFTNYKSIITILVQPYPPWFP